MLKAAWKYPHLILLIVLPAFFVGWTLYILTDVIVVRNRVEERVGLISILNDIDEKIESDKAISNDIIAELEASASFLPTKNAAFIVSLIQNKTVSKGEKHNQINKLVKELRSLLSEDSGKLGGRWEQLTTIGLLACVLAIFSALIYWRNFKRGLLLKERNEMLGKKTDELAALNDTKDRLFAIIGHDLRSPINSLKGLFDLVDAKVISQEEFFDFSSKLRDGVEHVHFALNNLLQWAHSQMMGIQTNKTRFKLKSVAEDTLNLLSEFARTKGIELKLYIDDELEANADPDHVKLILRNLVSNALKFTKRGGEVAIYAGVVEGNCQVEVRDNGIGMNKKRAQSLFKSGSIESRYGTGGEKGTGLGLLLCKEFVSRNQGQIWAESKPDEGTTVFFTLPIS